MVLMLFTFNCSQAELSPQQQKTLVKILKEQKEVMEAQNKFISNILKSSEPPEHHKPELTDKQEQKIEAARKKFKDESFDVLKIPLKFSTPEELHKEIDNAQQALNHLKKVIPKTKTHKSEDEPF